MPRLRRVDCATPGLTRVKRGRGFAYLDATGAPVTDEATLARIEALVIPPAWTDVWICPLPQGHIQATGTDAAGRRQYRYHDDWRRNRDRAKHERMLTFARALPAARERVSADLARSSYDERKVLAAAVRLLDVGFFRIGSEEYAEAHETFGLATLQRQHVTCQRGALTFDYIAKSGKHRVQTIQDPQLCRIVRHLQQRDDDGIELLAYKRGNRWLDVKSHDINDYLRQVTGGEFTAKDFRTWHATVLCAVALALSPETPASEAARKRLVAWAVKDTATHLGNTPAVCRASYIDPRVIDRWLDGVTIRDALDRLGEDDAIALATAGPVEEAVLALLEEPVRRRRAA